MLLSFSVENFLSIADEQKLSLVSDFGKELPSNAFEYNDKLKLLKSCVLYGANASGKSNFLKALLVMTTIITSSNSIDYPLPVKPFLFEKEKRHEPSLFEINVVIDGDRYQYGFSCTKERIALCVKLVCDISSIFVSYFTFLNVTAFFSFFSKREIGRASCRERV